jgi:hypothetical protein
MACHVRFLRQAALLLPSAFLLGVLVFLLTHGRTDPGFGTYPFFQQWAAEHGAARSPELRFLLQSGVFFVPAYLATLLFVLSIAAGERALFGRRKARKATAYTRAFGAAFPLLYFGASVGLLWLAERWALRQAPGSLVAPLLAAAAPFAAGLAALVPAAVLAGPIALVERFAAPTPRERNAA